MEFINSDLSSYQAMAYSFMITLFSVYFMWKHFGA